MFGCDHGWLDGCLIGTTRYITFLQGGREVRFHLGGCPGRIETFFYDGIAIFVTPGGSQPLRGGEPDRVAHRELGKYDRDRECFSSDT